MKKLAFMFMMFLGVISDLSSQWNTNPSVNNLVCSDAPFLTNTIEDFRTFQMVNDGSGGIFIAWRT